MTVAEDQVPVVQCRAALAVAQRREGIEESQGRKTRAQTCQVVIVVFSAEALDIAAVEEHAEAWIALQAKVCLYVCFAVCAKAGFDPKRKSAIRKSQRSTLEISGSVLGQIWGNFFHLGHKSLSLFRKAGYKNVDLWKYFFKLFIRTGSSHNSVIGAVNLSLFAWLLAARKLYEAGNWPQDWPAAPKPLALRGIELMQKDVDRAAQAFGADHPLVRIEQGDMNTADFGQPDIITILDALHYFDYDHQAAVLRRIHAALPAGGLFLTRVGDASAGLPYHLCNWVDHAVTFVRGHRLPRLYCRTLAEWVKLLREIGFTVETDPMNEGKPFANVMLVCRVAA